MVTYLAIGLVVLLIGAIWYGFGIVMGRPPSLEELGTESCVLCRRKFKKKELVEREVGDYKLFYFCSECIESLYSDATKRDGSAVKEIPKG